MGCLLGSTEKRLVLVREGVSPGLSSGGREGTYLGYSAPS